MSWFNKPKPEFDRETAARQLKEAESRGFQEGMNTTVWPHNGHNPYVGGWLLGGDAWDHAVRDARERGFRRGQELRRAEIKRICESEEYSDAD